MITFIHLCAAQKNKFHLYAFQKFSLFKKSAYINVSIPSPFCDLTPESCLYLTVVAKTRLTLFSTAEIRRKALILTDKSGYFNDRDEPDLAEAFYVRQTVRYDFF